MLVTLAACQEPTAAPATGEREERQILAVLDGTPIHADEVQQRIAFRLYQLEADRYALLQRELGEIIDQRLLEQEAQRRGVSVEALLAAGIQGELAPVTEADVDAYLAENPRDAARGAVIRPRIAAYLAERRAIERRLTFVQELRERARIEIRLTAPERPRTDIDIANAPARGPERALVTLVHFASFSSAESARSAAEIRAIVAQHPTEIRWVHRHHVDTYDELGLRAAELSLAAQDAGRFWDFHDRLMGRDAPLTEAALTEVAASMGLDAPPGDALARIKQHLDAGMKAGVERLPVVFVNGRYFSGTFSYDQLRALVAEELAAAGRGDSEPRGHD
ncbi:MAG TPA: thioredoxin domain-containing protein [Haliangium sp.]|nr:thioredoxin domain-containing protein [Haliangium sp.]